MSLLNELDKQVAAIEDQKSRHKSELQEQAVFYRDELRPVMIQALEYFSDIVQKLNIVKPEIHPNYPLNPLSEKPLSLIQQDYSLDFDNRAEPRQIDIFCSCDLPYPQKFYVPSRDAARAYADRLHSYGFPHQHKHHLDKYLDISGATFFLEGPMSVHIRVRADSVERRIEVCLYNLETQPFKRYRLLPGDFNNTLLQRLARLLLREESVLVKIDLSTDYRARLRQQIDQERAEKQRQCAESPDKADSSGSSKLDKGMGQRAKKAVASKLEAARQLIKNL
jgi:hypothetical protein